MKILINGHIKENHDKRIKLKIKKNRSELMEMYIDFKKDMDDNSILNKDDFKSFAVCMIEQGMI